jgi:hypothetical protein
MIEHCRILVAMRSKSAALMAPVLLRRAGDFRARFTCETKGMADERYQSF